MHRVNRKKRGCATSRKRVNLHVGADRETQERPRWPEGHRTFGFGALLGALLLSLVSNGSFVATFGIAAFRPILMGAFAGAGVLCAAELAVRRKRADLLAMRDRHRVASPLVAAMGPLAVLAFLAGIKVGGAEVAFAVALPAGLVLGAGCAALTLAWLIDFSKMGYRAFVTNALASFGVGVCLMLPCFAIPRGLAAITYEAVLVAASAGLLALSPSARIANDERSLFGGTGDGGRQLSGRERARNVGLPLFLAATTAGAFGMTWDPSLTPNQGDILQTYGLAVLVGQALAGLLYLLAIIRCNETALASLASTVILPLAGGSLLVIPTVAGVSYVPGSFLLTTLSWMCFSTLFLWTWTLVTSHAHSEGNRSPGSFVTALGTCSCATLLGMILIPIVGSTGQIVLVVLFAAYLVLVAATSHRRTAEKNDNESPDGRTKDFTARCAEIANTCQLSPRESEVLPYLCRGHSQAYIAQELSISQNTVHTHVRNIYGKLGVSSKEEVIALVMGKLPSGVREHAGAIGKPERATPPESDL